MSLSAAEVADILDADGPRPWVFRIAAPDGDLLVSKVGYASLSARQQFSARVKDFSFPRFTASDRGGNIDVPELRLTVAGDRELLARIESREEEWEGVVVEAWQVAPELYPEDWYLTFSGVLTRVEGNEAFLVEFTWRVDDASLQHDSPQEYVNRTIDSDPAAIADTWSKIARPIYGTHDSLGYTGKGFVELYLIDKANYIYGGVIGRIMGVLRVNGQDKPLAADTWTFGYYADRGIWYSKVTLTTDAYLAIYGDEWTDADAAGKAKLVEQTKVTVDCLGLGDNPAGVDSGGALIVNPIKQLVHYLSNFNFGSWRRLAWLTSARIGSYSELADFFDALGFKGSKVVAGASPGATQIAAWIKTFGRDSVVMAFWDRDGKLYFRLIDLTSENAYPEGPYAFQEKLDLKKPNDQQRVLAVVHKFVTDDVSGSRVLTVSARDPNPRGGSVETIEQEWGSAE